MSDLPVDVVRSKRRKRTAQAYLREGRLKVMVPFGLAPDEEAVLVNGLVLRVGRKVASTEVDLVNRARDLARKYGLTEPTSIEWSARQTTRWGSCTPAEGCIRISIRLASMPGWVLDSVLIHELAHLEEPNHGPRFKDLVGRYELSERAKGYLMAMGEGRASN
ncbi:MAG TPA: M48 family metallopeptidase [Acidimicrobiia bacterium]|nr:M48 family metallopeptidase [Acidimicrobiia bacterium]